MSKIPKTINYCWFGKGEKSKLINKCIESWKKFCPNYEIIEWNESNFDININKYVKEAYENKKWAFVSDYARLWILYNNGGIYLDTDVELIKNIDFLLKNESFFALETSGYINTGLGFGCIKNNDIVKRMLDSYEGLSFVIEDNKLDLLPCPVRNSESIQEIFELVAKSNTNEFKIGNNVFLGKEYFCPYEPSTGKMTKTVNTVGIHWFNATWRSKSINYRRNLLRPIKRVIGLNRFNKIKKFIRRKKK